MFTFYFHFSTLRQARGDNNCHGELVEPCLYYYETINISTVIPLSVRQPLCRKSLQQFREADDFFIPLDVTGIAKYTRS